MPIGLPFKLPDWPGFHWVGLLISVIFDACFHLIIFTVAGEPRDGEGHDKFTCHQNVERYRRLLKTATDEQRRSYLV